jgi:Protein of unknown function (DUF2934)
MMAEAAYFLAERRGFKPGHELEDWLSAEHEVNEACGLIESIGDARRISESTSAGLSVDQATD